MKVILALLLFASSATQACKTCYYYEQCAEEDAQDGECACCGGRPSSCMPDSEHCGGGQPTWELIEDYYDGTV